ncbi:MAG: DUF4286 family protein [Chitinophagaceae bacterium]|nr:DUF4286 family protein [Chitinophagaceae bacterium]MCB0741112.1 DUF4286 family protein [Chitinophagaceae bacterium]HQU56302.1 DUF4286 family protein [Chitinophagaceae bacterium]HQV05735.1 DUF4286 family protein [Chitinophagaceae bacterium]
MIIYNVTIKVEKQIADKWLQWLKDEHIDDVINTGCFTQAQIHQLIDVDETDEPTYVVQYFCPSKKMYETYLQLYAEVMRKKGIEKWGDKFVAFRTLMQVVH